MMPPGMNWKQQHIYKIKMAQACVDCNFRPACPRQIEYDHVRGGKLFNIGNAASGGSSTDNRGAEDAETISRLVSDRGGGEQAWISVVADEMAKCDPVCCNCHALRTWTETRQRQQGWPPQQMTLPLLMARSSTSDTFDL